MKKFIKFLLLFVIIGVIVAAVIGYSQRNRIAKAGIEAFGPKVLKAPVTLESISLMPRLGKGELKGLVIGNPEGFKTEHAFVLGSLSLEADIATIGKDLVRIKEIRIEGPEITVEGLKGKNLKQLQANAEAFSGTPEADAAEQEEKEADAAPERKVIIDNIYLTGGKINYCPVMGQSIPIPLPDLHLTAIGEASGGATAGEVIKQLLAQIDDAVFGAITGAGKLIGDAAIGSAKLAGKGAMEGAKLAGKGAMEGAELVGDVGAAGAEAIGKVDDVAIDAVTGAAGAVTDAAGAAGEAIGDAGKLVKGLGGLLGGKDKPKEEPKSE